MLRFQQSSRKRMTRPKRETERKEFPDLGSGKPPRATNGRALNRNGAVAVPRDSQPSRKFQSDAICR